MLFEKIRNRQGGVLLYGLTPPRATSDPDKLAQIAKKHSERINSLPIDGVIFYDIQDELLRNSEERPFAFLPTLDPLHYCELYLRGVTVPKIIYQCTGKYSAASFSKQLRGISSQNYGTVFVGASSKLQQCSLKLDEAYRLRNQVNPSLALGGIAIPERHIVKKDEHLRISEKIRSGCTFFVSQAVYDSQSCKNMLSDYYYHTLKCDEPLYPIVITLTPCGSLKTLKFMEWLGISIPGWLKNDLMHSKEILSKSLKACSTIAEELIGYCTNRNIPIGFNIESVSIRKEEIDASLELLYSVHNLLGAGAQGSVSK